MTTLETSSWIVIAVAIVSANLPWLSNRIFFFKEAADGHKKAIWCWLEVVALYLICGFMAIGLEKKMNGEVYAQDWEFYATTFSLFVVFSLPGFLYKYNLRHHFASN